MRFLFCFLILYPRPLSHDLLSRLIIWNVGQGSTTTFVNNNECTHIDLGGEFFPQPLAQLCRHKHNFLFLTHFDWDHLSFISQAQKKFEHFCLATKVTGKVSRRKLFLLSKIKKCESIPKGLIQITQSGFVKKNESSSFIIQGNTLVTGDNSKSQENKLLPLLTKYKIQYLVAGHHGSRTSTGPLLLQNLKNLKLVLISARKKRYGHPHREVMERLKKMAVPGLDTESYGHIIIDQ